MPTDNQGGKPASPGENRPVSPNQGGLSWTQPSSPGAFSGARPSQEKKTPPVQQKLLSLKDLPRSAPLAAVVGTGGSSRLALVASFVVGAVLGLLTGWAWFEKNTEPTKTPAPSVSTSVLKTAGVVSPPPKAVQATDAQGSLVVAGTQTAGLTVLVEKVSVASPSWVVVYESKEGKPGNALGAALFDAERTSGVVYLLRTTTAGQTYYAGLRRDDGDHVFSLQNDVTVQDNDGKLLLVPFQAQ